MTDTNFTIKQGSDWDLTVVVKDSAGVVWDLTNYTAKMQIRKEKDKSSQLYDTLTTENSRITITALEGKLDLSVSAAISNKYRFTTGYYDLEIIDSSNKVTRILEGIITLNKNVTD